MLLILYKILICFLDKTFSSKNERFFPVLWQIVLLVTLKLWEDVWVWHEFLLSIEHIQVIADPQRNHHYVMQKKVEVKCKNYTGKRKTLISSIKVCIFLFDTYMSFFLRIFWPSSLTEAAGEVLSYSSSTISWE